MSSHTTHPNRFMAVISHYRIEIIIFILALVIRLMFLVGFAPEQKNYDALADQYIYLDMGRNLIAGKGFSVTNPIFVADPGPTALEPPAYPLFIAVIMKTFGENFLAIRVIQAILSALTCVITYKIGQRVLSETPARVGALILCLYPPLIMYVRPFMSETLFIFTMPLAVLWTLRLLEKLSVLNSIIAGVCWIIAYYTRMEAVAFAGVTALYGLFILRRNYRQKPLWGIAYMIPGAIVFLLALSPWIIRNYQLFHRFMPTNSTSGFNLWQLNYSRYYVDQDPNFYPTDMKPEYKDVPNWNSLDEPERDDALWRLASDWIREHPTTYLYYSLTRINVSFPIIPRSSEFTTPTLLQPDLDFTAIDEFPLYNTPAERLRIWSFRILFVCALLGIIQAIRQKQWSVALLLLLLGVNVVRAAFIQGRERARIFTDPYMILFAANFLVAFYYYVKRTRINKSSQQIETGKAHEI